MKKISGYTIVDIHSGMVHAFRTTLQAAYLVYQRCPEDSAIINLVQVTEEQVTLMRRSEVSRVFAYEESQQATILSRTVRYVD